MILQQKYRSVNNFSEKIHRLLWDYNRYETKMIKKE